MRNRRTLALAVAIGAVVIAAAVAAAVAVRSSGESSDPFDIPFLAERPAAPFSRTLICSLLDDEGNGAQIKGQDGGTTNVVDGRAYWTFGDTLTLDGGVRSNNIAVTSDLEPDDCIDLEHKRDDGGVAAELLPKADGELTVWPAAGQVSVRPGVVHFLYNSVAAADYRTGDYLFNGIGLGRFDSETLESERVIDALIPQSALEQPMTLTPAVDMLLHEGYVYIYFAVNWNVRVGRVPVERIEDASAYRYWDGADWVEGAAAAVDILQTAGGQQAFNVDYNPYVGKWTAVYSTNTLSAAAIAYADAPEGPLIDETVLFDCGDLFADAPPPGPPPVFPALNEYYFCYHPTQHPELDKRNRQTIYVTYGNLAAYRLFLERMTLALPIYQWEDAAGRAVFARGDEGPTGYTRRGAAFYAPTSEEPGLRGVHDWFDPATGVHRYEFEAPGVPFVDAGITFHASESAGEWLAPVYRWDSEGDPARVLYSTFDLSDNGYRRADAPSFYAAALEGQPAPLDTSGGYVYWVHMNGSSDFGCCGSTNNPTRQTQEREVEFTLANDPSPRGYSAVVCSPVCGSGGAVVWSGRVTFSPNARGGKLVLTPEGPKEP